MWVRSLGREDPLEEEPTLVFLPGKSHGQRSLTGYSPWNSKELPMTEQLNIHVCIHKEIYNSNSTSLLHSVILTNVLALKVPGSKN